METAKHTNLSLCLRKDFRLAHLSDLHFSRMPEKRESMTRLSHTLSQLKQQINDIDALIITGDLVDRSDTDGYKTLKPLLDNLDLPYFVIMGNHDDRNKLRTAFVDTYIDTYLPKEGALNWMVDINNIRLIGLDSHVPHKSAGRLSIESLEFLRNALQTDNTCIVAVHHPPFDIGVEQQDQVKLDNAKELLAVLELHPPIALLCGHAHVYFTRQFAKTTAIIAPSPINTLNGKSTRQVQHLPISGGYLLHTISNFNLTTENRR